jgi:hypothetical protein
MVPVLGREVEQREQSLPLLCQAGDRLVVLGAIFDGEHVDGMGLTRSELHAK